MRLKLAMYHRAYQRGFGFHVMRLPWPNKEYILGIELWSVVVGVRLIRPHPRKN